MWKYVHFGVFLMCFIVLRSKWTQHGLKSPVTLLASLGCVKHRTDLAVDELCCESHAISQLSVRQRWFGILPSLNTDFNINYVNMKICTANDVAERTGRRRYSVLGSFKNGSIFGNLQGNASKFWRNFLMRPYNDGKHTASSTNFIRGSSEPVNGWPNQTSA